MTQSLQVAVIGAGPYGLSIAAHLRARNIEFRIFGRPMDSWRSHMPAGMFMKSEGFGNNIADPTGRFTLEHFCREKSLAYGDIGLPIPRETFTSYGLAFQQRLVPEVEDQKVVALDRSHQGFEIELEAGERIVARQVAVAVGISYFPYLPAHLAHLPPEFLSHSFDHHDVTQFKGRDVIVIGSGASALDLMAALDDAGAKVRLVARRPSLSWALRAYRPLWKKWLPKSALGQGWRGRFYEYTPMLFRYMSEQARLKVLRTYLGPSGTYMVKDQVERQPLLLGWTPRSVERRSGRVYLTITGGDRGNCELATDHIIAATGYRVDLGKLPFLGEALRARLQSLEGFPILSGDFQSSVAGLYFVGHASALTFGPAMRHILGTRYMARRVIENLAKSIPKQ
jgi:cation diffusion facilitator CzcD-associated flavoprotein CzcO